MCSVTRHVGKVNLTFQTSEPLKYLYNKVGLPMLRAPQGAQRQRPWKAPLAARWMKVWTRHLWERREMETGVIYVESMGV